MFPKPPYLFVVCPHFEKQLPGKISFRGRPTRHVGVTNATYSTKRVHAWTQGSLNYTDILDILENAGYPLFTWHAFLIRPSILAIHLFCRNFGRQCFFGYGRGWRCASGWGLRLSFASTQYRKTNRLIPHGTSRGPQDIDCIAY